MNIPKPTRLPIPPTRSPKNEVVYDHVQVYVKYGLDRTYADCEVNKFDNILTIKGKGWVANYNFENLVGFVCYEKEENE